MRQCVSLGKACRCLFNSNECFNTVISVLICGPHPLIENGDVTELPDKKGLKVQCKKFYQLAGPDTVRCVDVKWTELPGCIGGYRLKPAAFYRSERSQSSRHPSTCLCMLVCFRFLSLAPCKLDSKMIYSGYEEYLSEGKEESFYCPNSSRGWYQRMVRCVQGTAYYSNCKCNRVVTQGL